MLFLSFNFLDRKYNWLLYHATNENFLGVFLCNPIIFNQFDFKHVPRKYISLVSYKKNISIYHTMRSFVYFYLSTYSFLEFGFLSRQLISIFSRVTCFHFE